MDINTLIITTLAGYIGTTFRELPSFIMNLILYFTSNTLSSNTDESPKNYIYNTFAIRKLTRNSFYNKHLTSPMKLGGIYSPMLRPESQLRYNIIDEIEFKELRSNLNRDSENSLYKLLPSGSHIAYIGDFTWIRFFHEVKMREATVTTDEFSRNRSSDKTRRELRINFLGLKAKFYTGVFKDLYKSIQTAEDDLYDEEELLLDTESHEQLTYFDNDTFHRTSGRKIDTIFFKNKNILIDKIVEFTQSEDEYSRLGIPYKLNILLYGKPGTGKTSILKMVASNLTLNGMMYDLSKFQKGLEFYTSRYKRSKKVTGIVVIEEIDTISIKRNSNKEKDKKEKEDSYGKAHLRDLLELLDGNKTPHGLVSISTTNHIENLDDAIIRRFDLVLEVEDLDIDLAREMCIYYKKDISILDNLTFPVNPSKLSRLLLGTNI